MNMEARLVVSLARLKSAVEGFLSKEPIPFISPFSREEFRTAGDCLLRLGLERDAKRLVEECGKVHQWYVNVRFNDFLAKEVATSSATADDSRQLFEDFSETSDEFQRSLIFGTMVQIRDHIEDLQRAFPTNAMSEPASDSPTTTVEPGAHAAKKTKRSTEQGEARFRIIAALSKHHKYADGSRLNLEPIGNNQLAREAGVSESTASEFFKNNFKGYSKYRVACQNPTTLVAAIKMLNQEYAPYLLYGACPPEKPEHDERDS